jgi:DNA repair photolyase
MIQPFIGEFMFHPAFLEFSGNTCDHNCVYCFANIRKSKRELQLKSIIKQINKREIKTYTDALLSEGYPICMSNKSDPFSKSNYLSSIALGYEFTKIKNGLFIQTKGGAGIDEFIKATNFKKNIVWYITITTLNDTIRKRIEPFAPTTEERFDLAKRLKKMGYHVVLAINPIFEAWMSEKDLLRFIKIAKEIGITHVVTEALHLNKREVEMFSEGRRNAFTPEEIEYSSNKKSFQTYVKKILPILIENGISTVKLGMPYKTDFYEPMKKVFGHISPNQYEIINFAHKTGTGVYSFDKFYEVTADNKQFFERRIKAINSYLVKSNIHAWSEDEEAKQCFTLKDVMRKHWNNNKYPQSMRRNQAFRTVVDDKNEPIKDSNQNILLYFDYGLYPTERIINQKNCKDEKGSC